MLLDTLSNAGKYYALHPGFKAAFAFLQKASPSSLASGRHGIDGDKVYASVFRGPAKGRHTACLEAHRNYIDVQCVFKGADVIGIRELRECRSCISDYDASKDVMFFGDEPAQWITLIPRTFAILYPDDAHAPLAGREELEKIVVKVLCQR